MANYTLTYSDVVQGFPSFYSYNPDWMIGMNNHFYTFKGGNLYRHNADVDRNTFYESWWTAIGTPLDAFESTKLKSVFNVSPLETKLFKTINLEGDDAWRTTLATDINVNGLIESSWFEEKEASFFAFIRNTGETPANPSEYSLRSANGIGSSINVTGPVAARVIDFSITPLTTVGSILSIGDTFYYILPATTAPLLGGIVTAVNVDLPRGINQVVIDSSVAGAIPIAIPNPYFMYIKNSLAESHGVLGHYCVFEVENDSKQPTELFVVESEAMKSFP